MTSRSSPDLTPKYRNAISKTTQMTRPARITCLGPQRSDSAPESQAATAAVTPYAVKITATLGWEIPSEVRYGERNPDSTPSPIMNRRSPTYPQASGG